MKIGILVTGHVADELQPRHGDYDRIYADFLSGHGFDFTPFFVVDGQFPTGPDVADAWIITGSRHGAYEDHDWIAPLEDLIRAIVAEHRPLVGICFGHQIIAQAMGGRVEKFAGGWTVGRTRYDTASGPLFMNAWHQDQVIDPPMGAQVLASSETCANAMMRIGETVFTVQAHPEFSREYASDLLEARGPGVVPDALLNVARAGQNDPLHNCELAEQIATFLKTASVPV